MKLRSLFLIIFFMSLLLCSCDLDVVVDQAILLDDPVTFLGERQIQVNLSGPDLTRTRDLGIDLDAYLSQKLRTNLPPAWEAAWSIETDAIILDFVLPFQGLDDYQKKMYPGASAQSFIDLAEGNADSFPPSDVPTLLRPAQDLEVFPGSEERLENEAVQDIVVAQNGMTSQNNATFQNQTTLQNHTNSKDIGCEIFTHQGDFLQAGISGLASAYFEPVRHELYEGDNLLFYLSLGEPGHWTKADLYYLEALPSQNLRPYIDIVRTDFAETLPSESEVDPRLRYGNDLFIVGEQVYETEVTEQGERILRQSRVLPLELEVATYSDDLLSFSRTLRLRLPQDPSGESLLRIADRLNLGILDDLSFQPESNPQNKVEAVYSKLEMVSLSQLRDYTRLLLGEGYTVELTEGEGSDVLWEESYDLPEFFTDETGPRIKLQGLLDETLAQQARTASAILTAKRSWPAMALQTFWDEDAQTFVRRYHYYVDEAGAQSILTEYLMEQSLDDYPVYSRSEDGYQHVFLEQRTPDPSTIAEQTSKLLGPTTIESTEESGLFGKIMHWVEHYRFDKIVPDQVIHLADGESYRGLRQKETMPGAGILTLNLTLQSNLSVFLGLGLLILVIGTLLHPRSALRASLLKGQEQIIEYRSKKQREIEERPLGWGATFQDPKGRRVKIIALEPSEPEPRRRLRFR